MAVLGLAPFPKELHLGDLSASGNGCLQSSLQPGNATEFAQSLENWNIPGSRGQHHCAQQLMPRERTQPGSVGMRCSQPW